jgi:hypothetical protein
MGFGFMAAEGVFAQSADLMVVPSYYVRADGNDADSGTSEDAPFKTLAKAVEAAAKTTAKKIIVIGTLAGNTVIEDADPTVQERARFVDKPGDKMGTVGIEWSADERDPDEILITGKPDASGTERAILAPANHDADILTILASTVRLEHIELSGLRTTDNNVAAVWVEDSVVTLAKGAKITQNRGKAGAGIYGNKRVEIIRDDAEASGNEADNYNGVRLVPTSVLVMRDKAHIIGNKAAENGGGVSLSGSSLFMHDDSFISDNSGQ